VTSGVPQESVQGPNDICRNVESNIRLLEDDCILYREILNIKDMEILQRDLNRLRDCAVRKDMKMYPNKVRYG
jgi:hypothetical protein